MSIRKTPFVNGEHYHVYLRGVEKRAIVLDDADVNRFLTSLNIFNSMEPVGSVYQHSFRKDQLGNPVSKSKLVEIFAFNLLDNHYHLLLKQCVDGGISRFMKSVNGGYTKYFNTKYKRTGHLFQDVFGAVHIKDDAQLIYTNAYVNLNNIVHAYYEKQSLGNPVSKWGKRSSWEQYINPHKRKDALVPCSTDFILSMYSSVGEYKKDAMTTARMIATERRRLKQEENDVLKSHLETGFPSGRGKRDGASGARRV